MLSVMIDEIKTHRFERMVGSNLCLNLCSKILRMQKNMPIPHRKDISITQISNLTQTIRNDAEFELPVGMTST